MNLQFAGEKCLPFPLTTIWPRLRDARFVVQAIPDGSPGELVDADKATATVRPSLSFLSGTLDVTVQITDAVEPTSLRWLLTSKGIGASSVVEATVRLAEQDTGTRINWTAEVKEVTGLLKALPSGLIRGAAQRVIDDVWTGIDKQLAEKTA